MIRAIDAPVDPAPGEAIHVTGPFRARLFSDAGGLTQFGALEETLDPGSRSSICHWHRDEDEFVYVLAGEVTVHEGGTVTAAHPGDAVCWTAAPPLDPTGLDRHPRAGGKLTARCRAARPTLGIGFEAQVSGNVGKVP